jgi:hypothetical protein
VKNTGTRNSLKAGTRGGGVWPVPNMYTKWSKVLCDFKDDFSNFC